MSTVLPQEQTEVAPSFPAGLTYTAYVAFRAPRNPSALAGGDRSELVAEAEAALAADSGVALRGAYSTSGYRADADVLLWLAGPSADSLQDTISALRRTRLGRALEPFWFSVGVHREAEFSKSHVPAFFVGEEPRRYVCVYPSARRRPGRGLELRRQPRRALRRTFPARERRRRRCAASVARRRNPTGSGCDERCQRLRSYRVSAPITIPVRIEPEITSTAKPCMSSTGPSEPPPA